jgi:predicted CXXCH cytochrome family protein
MYEKGVTCMDCHDAHALKLRAEGNALCTRCHNAAVFDTGKHHFHKAGTKSAQCVECHMPAQNYMVIDARRDHGIRVPRPDLSIKLGSPNACTQCHTDRKPEWAAAAMDQWYGKDWRAEAHYGTALHAAATQGAKALPSLLVLADDPSIPPIVRATAATLAQPYLRSDLLPAVRKLLTSGEPLIRIAALGQLEAFDAAARAPAAAPLLADPVRGVRVEAARLLADVPDVQIPAERRDARGRALKEYEDSLHQDADWPTANVNLGNLYLRQGRAAEAIVSFQRALSLDARFAGAYVNLADAYRGLKRDAEGEKLLRRGLAVLPRAADLHHALGLLLVRKGDKTAALPELALAAKLAPDNARYAFVHAVGLHSAGKRAEALAVLRAADTRHPYDLEVLSALISMHREAGDARAALIYAKKAAEVLPNDAALKKLVAELEGK